VFFAGSFHGDVFTSRVFDGIISLSISNYFSTCVPSNSDHRTKSLYEER
jgi:hypothetical protein